MHIEVRGTLNKLHGYAPETKTMGVVVWKINLLPRTSVTSVNFVTPPFQNRRNPRLILLLKMKSL